MENEIDFGVVQSVADALDVPMEKLVRNRRLAAWLTELFRTSPHSGRERLAMIRARTVLAGMLGCSLRRQETDDYIAVNPDAALELIEVMQGEDGVQTAFGTLERRCRKAVQDGGPERL